MSNPLTTDSGRKNRVKVGDSVDLGAHGQGQIWAPAPGVANWHAVDANQNAHIYNERSKGSSPARSTEFELAAHKARVDQAYEKYGGGAGPTTRRWNLTDGEANSLAKVKPKKTKWNSSKNAPPVDPERRLPPAWNDRRQGGSMQTQAAELNHGKGSMQAQAAHLNRRA